MSIPWSKEQLMNANAKLLKKVMRYESQLKEMKGFVIECDADERSIQPYEILDRINSITNEKGE